MYNTTVNNLKNINNLTSDTLSLNQMLLVPVISPEKTNIEYIVKGGDSLYSIGKRYGVSVDAIKSLNNLTSNLLSIGQKLLIPV